MPLIYSPPIRNNMPDTGRPQYTTETSRAGPTMTDLILHGLSHLRAHNLMVRKAKGAHYIVQPVDFRSPEYRKDHHPFGRVPSLTHGEVKLYETLAIVVYVDEAFDGPSLPPREAKDKAMMFQWISVINDYVYKSVVVGCVIERFVKPMRGADPDLEHIAANLPAISTSLADMFLAPILHYFRAPPEGERLLPPPNLIAWMNRLEKVAGYTTINTLSPA